MAVRLLEFNILTITIIKKKVTKYKKKKQIMDCILKEKHTIVVKRIGLI